MKEISNKNMISQVSGTKQIMIPHSGNYTGSGKGFLLLHLVTKIYAINHARKQSMWIALLQLCLNAYTVKLYLLRSFSPSWVVIRSNNCPEAVLNSTYKCKKRVSHCLEEFSKFCMNLCLCQKIVLPHWTNQWDQHNRAFLWSGVEGSVKYDCEG